MLSVYEPPKLSKEDDELIERIRGLYRDLRLRVSEPRRWSGALARMQVGRAVQGSNSIEGYNASMDDVLAAMDNEEPLDADEETRQALGGYRDALTYVLQLAHNESNIVINEQLVKSLHFMMMKYDLLKNPGQWRPGFVNVVNNETGEVRYVAPDRDLVPELMRSMLYQIKRGDSDPLIKGAMAHLNLTMIHPFSDGNGRMARCLQTLVLAEVGVLSPTFSSIEENLGRHRQEYYDVLKLVAPDTWSPERDALPFVRLCLNAHLDQALRTGVRVKTVETIWVELTAHILATTNLPERVVSACFEAAVGRQVRRPSYIKLVVSAFDEEISKLVASRDLKRLVDEDLLEPHGSTRGRYYTATESLRKTVEPILEKAKIDSGT